MNTHRTVRSRRAWFAALALAGTALSSTLADAHFRLIAPGNWMVQSADGTPQKMGPCGNEAPQTPSNVVTPFRPGDTVTVQLEETVFHPGHYRVALAVNSANELPAEPPVTAGTTACGTVPIQSPPVYPVLADGMLQHTAAFTGQQSFQVKLPTNVTCTACTLQIIEFMSSHAAPCFYHHCATISIQPATTDAGTGAPDAARDSSGGAGGAAGGAGGDPGSGGAAGSGTAGRGGVAGAGAAGGNGSGATVGSGGASGSAGASSGASGQGGATGSDVGTTGCACSLARADATSLAGAIAVLGLAVVARRQRGRRRS